MRYYLSCIAFCITAAVGYTQTKMPGFGKIDKEDLLMKECATDKSAPYMILGNEGLVEFNWDESRGSFDMQKKIHVRIKVFSDKGLDRASVKIVFFSDDKYEQISGVAGNVYNLNDAGEVVTTKLTKDEIFKKKEDNQRSSVTFSLPGVKVGSVFEYRYTLVKKSFSNIDPWMFQREVPTRLSIFEIEMPEYFRFTPRINIGGDSQLEKNQEDGLKSIATPGGILRMGVTRYRYTLKDVAGLKSEPYMTGYKDYLQRIELQLSEIIVPGQFVRSFRTSWEKLAEELYESDYFGAQIKKRIAIAELDAGLEKITGNLEKIEYIHHYVRSHFDWDGKEDFTCLNVKDVAEKRNGSTGDINLLLVNLLKHNGIEAYPLLVSTRDHGRVLTTYPFLQQFNSLNVMAKDGEKWYILNGADKYNSTSLIPYDVMTTEGLMVEKKNSSWVSLWDPAMTERHNVSYMGTLSDDGYFSGDTYLISGGYSKNPKLKALKNGNEKYINEYLKSKTQGIEIENFSVKNQDNDTLNLEQKFKFKMKVSSSGDYVYFNTNLFTGLEDNPFLADTRTSDIDFGYNRRISLSTRVVFPDNFLAEELPRNVRMIMPDTSISFTRTFFKEENTLILRMVLEFNRPIFSAAEYPEFREFYKKLFEMLNEQVVLKRKK